MYFGGSLAISAAAATAVFRTPALLRIVSYQGWMVSKNKNGIFQTFLPTAFYTVGTGYDCVMTASQKKMYGFSWGCV